MRQRQALLYFKRIPLADIDTIVFDPNQDEAVVFGKNGLQIVHTKMHVERQRFIERIESLTGKKLVLVGASQ